MTPAAVAVIAAYLDRSRGPPLSDSLSVVARDYAKPTAEAGFPRGPLPERRGRGRSRRVLRTALPLEPQDQPDCARPIGDQAVDRLLIEPVLAARHLPTCRLSPAHRHRVWRRLPGDSDVPRRRRDGAADGGGQGAQIRVPPRSGAASRISERAVVENATYEELLARPELHESCQSVSVRAVRVETRVLTTLQAFLAIGGRLLLFRGPTGPEEPASSSRRSPGRDLPAPRLLAESPDRSDQVPPLASVPRGTALPNVPRGTGGQISRFSVGFR